MKNIIQYCMLLLVLGALVVTIGVSDTRDETSDVSASEYASALVYQVPTTIYLSKADVDVGCEHAGYIADADLIRKPVSKAKLLNTIDHLATAQDGFFRRARDGLCSDSHLLV